jgi:hypothetical protein
VSLLGHPIFPASTNSDESLGFWLFSGNALLVVVMLLKQSKTLLWGKHLTELPQKGDDLHG